MFHTFQTYNLFISHSWDYHQDYEKLIDWLAESNIYYKNYNIPIEKELDVSGILEF